MNLPLIITDVDGSLLYASRGVTVSGALRLWLSATAKCYNAPVVYRGSTPVVVRKILLGGKRYYFFVEADKFVECFGVEELREGESLFATFEEKWKSCVLVSLKTLVRTFSRAYLEELFDDGVRVSLGAIAEDVFVNVPPGAFMLCLALMTKLTAEGGCEVKLSLANDMNRAVVYADSVRGSPLKTSAREVLEVLLYEVSGAAGFRIDKRLKDEKWSYKLELTPVDIGLYGFKAQSLARFEKEIRAYISMFL